MGPCPCTNQGEVGIPPLYAELGDATQVKRGAAFECGGSLRGSQCTEGEPQIRRTKAVPRGLKQLADNKITALHRRLKRRCRTAGELFFAGDTDRNDMLSFAEFCKGVAAVGIRPPPSEEELELIFGMYDTSRDGFIQWEEFTREDDIATNRGADSSLISESHADSDELVQVWTKSDGGATLRMHPRLRSRSVEVSTLPGSIRVRMGAGQRSRCVLLDT